MAFGDYLKNNVTLLKYAGEKKTGENAFVEILKKIAVEEISRHYPNKVDSGNAVPIYYEILRQNEEVFPQFFREKLGKGEERYRVINRNMWTSNAFHTDGLANQAKIQAYKVMNKDRKGYSIVYQGKI